jgi:hypothetical protein
MDHCQYNKFLALVLCDWLRICLPAAQGKFILVTTRCGGKGYDLSRTLKAKAYMKI